MPRPKKQAPNRADGRYQYALTIGTDISGKRIRKYFYSTKSLADAKAQAEQWQVAQQVSEITGVDLGTSPSVNFTKWANAWLQSVKGSVKDNTWQLTYYNYTVNHLIPYFGKMDLENILPIHVQTFLNEKKNTHKPESVKKMLRCLNLIYNSAIDNQKCRHNPCAGMSIKIVEKTTKNIYTQEQADLVMSYTYQHRYGFEIRLLLRYGLRRGELLGIIPALDVNYEDSSLHIQRAVADAPDPNTRKSRVIVDTPKTSFSDRYIPLAEEDALAFQQLPDQSNYAFPNSSGTVYSPWNWSRTHYSAFMHDMHQYYLEQNIDVPELNPHELRHTRTSLWVNNGKNLFSVASVMGWGDLKMLRKRYAHPDIEQARKNLDL